MGAEGAAALGPHLGKWVKMQTLNLNGMHARCVVVASLE